MKKYLLSFVLVITSVFHIFSQSESNGTIEVTVSDTVILKPIKIIYQINSGNSNEFMGMTFPDEEENVEDELLVPISEISTLLNAEKYKFKLIENKDYNISSSSPAEFIEVELKNEEELKKLYQTLKGQTGITGKIKSVEYEPISKYYETIYQDLYKKAVYQAQLLSKISNITLGKVNSIAEVAKQENQYIDLYNELFKMMPLNLNFNTDLSGKSEEIKMIFTFEVK